MGKDGSIKAMAALEVRLTILEQQHNSMERSAMEFMRHATSEENSIHQRLDELVHEVHKIPEMVSSKLNECRLDMRVEMDKAHPRRHEVVTPKALMMAAGLLAVVLVAGMSATMVIWDKVDDRAHAVHTEQMIHDSASP